MKSTFSNFLGKRIKIVVHDFKQRACAFYFDDGSVSVVGVDMGGGPLLIEMTGAIVGAVITHISRAGTSNGVRFGTSNGSIVCPHAIEWTIQQFRDRDARNAELCDAVERKLGVTLQVTLTAAMSKMWSDEFAGISAWLPAGSQGIGKGVFTYGANPPSIKTKQESGVALAKGYNADDYYKINYNVEPSAGLWKDEVPAPDPFAGDLNPWHLPKEEYSDLNPWWATDKAKATTAEKTKAKKWTK